MPCIDFATIVESALLIIATEKIVLGETIEPDIFPADRRGSTRSPLQDATATGNTDSDSGWSH